MKAIVALAGGVGAARFLEGLARLLPRHRTFIIGNTGDDVARDDFTRRLVPTGELVDDGDRVDTLVRQGTGEAPSQLGQ